MGDQPSDFERFVGSDRRRPRLPSGLAAVVAVIACAVLVGIIVLTPRTDPDIVRADFDFADDVVPAIVTEVVDGPCSYGGDCTTVNFELVDPVDGEQITHIQEFPVERGQPTFEAGDEVYLSVVSFDGQVAYNYYDRNRGPLLLVVAIVFGAAVVALGRMRGVAALLGLALSVGIILWFIVPAIIAGRDAVLVALVGGGAIALVALYLAHGVTPLTHVAAVGAFAALALTTGLSWIVVQAAHFTGLTSDESFYLVSIPEIDLSGLILAGIVLGTLGALDDVTVTQASAVLELDQANPGLGISGLFDAGLRIGRDHIASTVNTLLLAYAGAAMPVLILFSLSAQPLTVIASSEVVAVEIVRTLVGSIGLVAAVPITTWLAARRLGAARTS